MTTSIPRPLAGNPGADPGRWRGAPGLVFALAGAVLGFALGGCATPPAPPAEGDGRGDAGAGGPLGLANDTARFLAGLPGDSRSPLAPLRGEPGWQRHASALDASWRQARARRLDRIEAWQRATLSPQVGARGTVFYPFGGPDFQHVDAMFPEASTIILCGLEPVASLPDLADLAPPERDAALAGLRTSLETLLGASYFVTKDMARDLRATALEGVAPPIVVQTARAGNRLEGIVPIALSADGQPVPRDSWGGWNAGIRLDLADARARRKTLYYIRTNLANASVRADRRFLSFVAARGPVTTFVKSASYLMHDDGFSEIRTFVLAHSRVLLQDDSGVPFRFLAADDWDTRLYGAYHGTLGIFERFRQPDLAEAFTQRGEPTGFGLGYQVVWNESPLMLAHRRTAPRIEVRRALPGG